MESSASKTIVGIVAVCFWGYIGLYFYRFGAAPPHLVPLIATWLIGATIIGLIVERVTLPRDPAPALDLSEEVSGATAAIDETLRTSQVLTDKRELRQLRDEAYSARRRWALLQRQTQHMMTASRKAYTQSIRYKPPAVLGRGRLARAVRGIQSLDRHKARVDLANALAPYELAAFQTQHVINCIDYALIELDAKIKRL